MNKTIKLFLIGMWGVAIAGGVWGWVQFAKSGSQLLALPGMLMKYQAMSAGRGNLNNASWGDMDLNAIDQEAVQDAQAATKPAGPADLSCVEKMKESARSLIEQYVAENGMPSKRVDLKQEYNKTPQELKETSFTGGTCSAQYIYCDLTSCGYSVSYMESKGRYSTMAASVMGTRFGSGENVQWHLSCFDISPLGKKICEPYTSKQSL